MAKQDDYVRYTIRVPAELYERLQQAAGAKSINAEITERLDRSFYEDTEDNFLRTLAEGRFLEPLPSGLAGRIQAQAEARKQSVQEEVVQALEAAFPPPPQFSLDWFNEAWLSKIVSAPNSERPSLIEQANAVLQANAGQYEVWLDSEEEGGQDGAVMIGLKSWRQRAKARLYKPGRRK